MVLLLGAIFGACTLGLGFRALTHAADAGARQRAIRSFDTFIERARITSLGGAGSAQPVELELPDSHMLIDGKLIQLMAGEEVLRSELLPLPALTEIGLGGRLTSGRYLIELKRATRDRTTSALIDNGALRVGGYYLELGRG